MKLVRQLDRKIRETRMFVRAMQSASHPILAQIVPIRRCNLDCSYCNEYDKTSAPVPLETMVGRIDRLADLGATIITLSGGEPTLHPDLDVIIRRIRGRGAIATLITNGLLLTPDRIRALNRSGLDYLADQHRQSRARRRFEKELTRARPEAGVAGAIRGVRRHYQLRVGSGHSQSRGRHRGRHACPGTRLHQHRRHFARS